MSQGAKIITGFVVVVIVLGGLYYWYSSQHASSSTTGTAQTVPDTETTTLPTGSSTSDTSLNQDLNSIDTQIQGVSSDNANVNDSVNAQAAQ